MKRELRLEKINCTYELIFAWYFYPLFLAYFGENLKLKGSRTEKKVTISYQLSVFGSEVFYRETDQKLYVRIPLPKLIRAAIRSAYQILMPTSSNIGLFEYFVYIFRGSILDHIEEDLRMRSFCLVHGAVVKKDHNVILLFAKSGGGKSTLADLLSSKGFEIICDNYVFFNGSQVVTIPECRRLGPPPRLGVSFYGKGVHEVTKHELLDLNCIICLEFSSTNKLTPLSKQKVSTLLCNAYISEGEGSFYNDRDAVSIMYESLRANITVPNLYQMNLLKNISSTNNYVEELIRDRAFDSQ